MISLKFNVKTAEKTPTKTRHIYDRGNYEEMKRSLDIEWENYLLAGDADINEIWGRFTSKLNETIENCIPSKKITPNERTRKYAVPMNRKALSKIKRKQNCGHNT